MSATVCIIDDDEAMRDTLARIVRVAGLEAETHASAESFLQRPFPSSVGCLLVDAHLGGISGIELLERLAADALNVPVIVVSGSLTTAEATRARSLGAITVDKPFDARALRKQIRAAVLGNQLRVQIN